MAKVTGDDGTPSGFSPVVPFGVWGDSGDAAGNGVIGSSPKIGVEGVSLEKPSPVGQPPKGAGVRGDGVIGVAGFTTGANARPGSIFIGVLGCAANDDDPRQIAAGRGVLGLGVAIGVEGRTLTGTGVFGHATEGLGVGGESISGNGVQGFSFTKTGVEGGSLGRNGAGVQGQSSGVGGAGVRGIATADASTGVVGQARGDRSIGVLGIGGIDRRAGFFSGKVHVTDVLTQGGSGFVIDHPLDPEGRFLNHSSVESPERKNLYDGTVSCDDKGEAIVELPDWFEPLNGELRYQLTPIGQAAPNLHVASEVAKGRFQIAGGTPGLRVSWLVTGVRQDAWAKSQPLAVEQDKAADEKGFFLHPEAHGHTIERSLYHTLHEEAEKAWKSADEHAVAVQARKPEPGGSTFVGGAAKE